MELIVIGSNFRTTSLGEREAWLVPLQKRFPNAVFLATCNRVEIYAVVKAGAPSEQLLAEWGIAQAPGYVRRGEAAFAHLIRVAAGLDSMVLGETEVFGQVKQAYTQSLENCGPLLNFVFQRAFSIVKKIRTETGISRLPVSICSAGLILLEQIFGEFEKVKAAVVGLGGMGRQMALGLAKRKVGRLFLFSRNLKKVQNFARRLETCVSVLPLQDLPEHIPGLDLLVASIAQPGYLVHPAQCPTIHSFKVFLDLGVPRNLDPGLGEAENLLLYNVDDLKTIAVQNLASRQKEAQLAERIIEKEISTFHREWDKRAKMALESRGKILAQPKFSGA